MKVTVEGELRWSQWERDGQKRSKIDVIVNEIDFMSSRSSGNSGGSGDAGYSNAGNNGYSGGSSNYSSGYCSAPVVDASSSLYDEDIPF